MNKKTPPREANLDSDGKFAIEPYCGQCSIDIFATGKTYCNCGHTYEERRDSGWKLNGEKT